MLASLDYGVWAPPDFSTHGHGVDRLIDVLHYFMAVLFVFWTGFFVYCLVRFRRGRGGTAAYSPIRLSAYKYFIIGVAVFEIFLEIGVSMPVWAAYKNEPPDPNARFEVRVVGEQFQWNFHYPGPDGAWGRTAATLISPSNPLGIDDADPASKDDVFTINEFHVPVDRPIYVRLRSKDVIHSFFIPTMRVKQDVIPGMEIPIWFTVKPEATTDELRKQFQRTVPIESASWYRLRHHVAAKDHVNARTGEAVLAQGSDLGLSLAAGNEMIAKLRDAGVTELVMQPRNPLEVVCAQLCGNEHYKMKAQMITHVQSDFDAWIQQKIKEKTISIEDFDL